MNKIVLERIRSLMLKKHLSYYQLALDSNLQRGTIKNWFVKDSEPSAWALESVAASLGVSMAQLYSIDNTIEVSEATKEHVLSYEMLSDEDQKAIDKSIDALIYFSTKEEQ